MRSRAPPAGFRRSTVIRRSPQAAIRRTSAAAEFVCVRLRLPIPQTNLNVPPSKESQRVVDGPDYGILPSHCLSAAFCVAELLFTKCFQRVYSACPPQPPVSRPLCPSCLSPPPHDSNGKCSLVSLCHELCSPSGRAGMQCDFWNQFLVIMVLTITTSSTQTMIC